MGRQSDLEERLLDLALVHLVLQPAVTPLLLRPLLGQEAGFDLHLSAEAPALLLPLLLLRLVGGDHLLVPV